VFRVLDRRRTANIALALLTGVLLVLLFPNFSFTWLAPVALTPLLLALSREDSLRWRFLYGYFAGVLYWFSVCTWIEGVLEYFGAMGKVGGWGAFLLFCVAKAIHLGVFALFAAILLRKSYAVIAVPALWTGIERTHGPLGFAWLTLGDAGTSMGLPMRLAPFTGVYGLSFVFALTACALALLIFRRPRLHIAWCGVLLLLPLLPSLPTPAAGDKTAVLVQTNAAEDAEWNSDSLSRFEARLMEISLTASTSAPAELIVWPESPLPLYYYRGGGFQIDAQNLARASNAYFILGSVAPTLSGDPANSALLISPEGKLVERYDKMNLVPFGEFIPPGFGWVNRITSEAGDFVPGKRVVTLPVDGHSIGAFICYESAFPDFVRRFTAKGADLLVNISNDGYFGRSAARNQHLKLVRMRAAENARWILRDTNNGVTAVIDPAGRIAAELPSYKQIAARVRFSYETRMTFYAQYGDWFAWSCLILSAIALLLPRFKKI
jgi:apolipoprotein N-acyltransferase